jgi:hypothetical protein
MADMNGKVPGDEAPEGMNGVMFKTLGGIRNAVKTGDVVGLAIITLNKTGAASRIHIFADEDLRQAIGDATLLQQDIIAHQQMNEHEARVKREQALNKTKPTILRPV